MALQLWMPLTKDFSNQGLYQSASTTSGGSIVNGGKLGKCCLTNSTTSINTNVPFDVWNINQTSVSMCGWFKFNKSQIQTVVDSVTLTGSQKQISCNLIGYNSYGGLSIECETNNLVSSSFSTLKVYGAYRNASTSYVTRSYTITYDTWIHLALVYDLSESSLSLYVNGSLFQSKEIVNASYTATPTFRINNNDVFGGKGPAKCLPFYVNDVRLYDHALSQAEVHSLSQGLVVHYKMDDEYSETTTNLGNTSATYSNQTEGNAYTANSWGGDAGTVIYYKSGGYNNGPYKVYHKTATGNGGIYRKTDNDITIVQGKTYTMSIYVKASRDYTDSIYSFNINGVTSSDSNHYITASSSVHFTTEWTRIERTFTASANDAGTYGEMSIIYNDNVTDYYVYFSCFQIEEKDHATPFVIGTRNGTIFDDSGYQNDGTITGNLQIKNNSPRYRYCAQFTDSATSIGIGNLSTLLPEGVFTFNIWFKKITNEWSSKTWETIFGGPSGFELETKNGSTNSPIIKLYNWGGGTTSYSLDQWNMITFCRNSSETKLYLNGELKITGSSGSVPSGNYFIGAWNSITQQNYRGYLSDARLYATALSSDDILSLYQLGARIDNKKNLHTFEIEENGYNLLSPYTFPLAFGKNLTYATQTNGKTVIEDNHFKITRNPNITGTLNGNTGGTQNWCGIIFRNYDNILGFQQGHHYLVCINVKGYSDTAMNDISISNYCDWSASSLNPITTTDNIQTYNPVVAGYNSDTLDTVALYFEINSPLYKVLTGKSYSTFVKGQSYLSFRDIKFGFTYTTTTSVGTNLELDNLRLYDVTNLDVLTRIKREGITQTISFIEDGDNGIIKNGDLQSNNIYEI